MFSCVIIGYDKCFGRNTGNFKVVSSTSMFFFFIASLVFLTAIFLMLAWQVRREKAALNYAATTVLAWLVARRFTIRKALDTMAPNLLVDALSFVSLVLVVVGATFQTSVSMSRVLFMT